MRRRRGGGVPVSLVVLIALVGATLAGLPVASWAAGLAVLAFAFGALALIVGADDAAKRLFGAWVGCVAIAVIAGAIGEVGRVLLHDPRVVGALCVLFTLAMLVGLLVLTFRIVALAKPHGKLPKLIVRERVPVRDPAPRGADVPRPKGPRQEDDDLRLFRGGRRGSH